MARVQSRGSELGVVQDIQIYGRSFKCSVEKEGRDRNIWRPGEIKVLTACLDNLCRDKIELPTACKELFYILRALPYLLLY